MIRVGSLPLDSGGNPYISLLYGALRAEGVSIQEADLRPWKLPSPGQSYDTLHVHWPEYIMAGRRTGIVRKAQSIAAAAAFRYSVRTLQARGVRIVWTAHNIAPHNPDSPSAQVDLYRWLAQTADGVIVHTRHAGELVRQRLGRRGPIYLAHHGNYLGAYDTPAADRSTLRGRYGFGDSDKILLAFGQIRGYKRLVELASDFQARSSPSTHMIIAGAPKDVVVVERLKEMAASCDRLLILDRYIPESEVGELYAIADLGIFNYSEIFSSGALLLAFSLGLAVVAPLQGTGDGEIGRPALFAWEISPFEALEEALAVPGETRRKAALETAHAHGWAVAAQVHIAAYEGGAPNFP